MNGQWSIYRLSNPKLEIAVERRARYDARSRNSPIANNVSPSHLAHTGPRNIRDQPRSNSASRKQWFSASRPSAKRSHGP